MEIKQVLRVVSILLLILSIFFLIPIIIALIYNEKEIIKSFVIPVIIIVLFFIFIHFLTKNTKSDSLSTRDGFLLVTFSWILSAFFGSLPFYLSGAVPSYVNAFFETMSGFTTTGASILTDIESLPKSILFWRSLTHWLGGMGIVVLTVAILPILGIGGLQLLKAEAPGPSVDKITSKITETAKILWFLYVGFTIAETLLLFFGGMNLFDSLIHTFGTLATGGFSSKALSVGHFNSAYIDIVITVFMLIAGVNFVLSYKLITGRFKNVFEDTELRAYIGIFIAVTIIITLNLHGSVYNTIGKSLRFAGFQAASILTTTGYATADFEKWPVLSQIFLFLLMFIGGCSGSTGGGIKVVRILTLFKLGFQEMKYLLHPRGIFSLKISGKIIKKDMVYAISGFIFLYLLILFITTIVVASGGNDILTSFSTALATVGNIGPGFGKIGPAENYAFYPDYIKWFLTFAMIVGRLEIYTVLVIFTPLFWRGRKK